MDWPLGLQQQLGAKAFQAKMMKLKHWEQYTAEFWHEPKMQLFLVDSNYQRLPGQNRGFWADVAQSVFQPGQASTNFKASVSLSCSLSFRWFLLGLAPVEGPALQLSPPASPPASSPPSLQPSSQPC
eukprot:3660712-Rhodomonas_salina.3